MFPAFPNGQRDPWARLHCAAETTNDEHCAGQQQSVGNAGQNVVVAGHDEIDAENAQHDGDALDCLLQVSFGRLAFES